MFSKIISSFHREPEQIPDDTEFIYLTEDGSFNFPLTCEDSALYATCLNDIRSIFTKWIAEDQRIASDTGVRVDGTVSYLLGTLDLKFLALPGQTERLFEILKNDGISWAGSRFMDAILLINTTIPTPILECYKGKFLYGAIYGLPSVIDDKPLPTKEMWVDLMREAPYVPFLLLLQEVLSDSLNISPTPSATVQPTPTTPAP